MAPQNLREGQELGAGVLETSGCREGRHANTGLKIYYNEPLDSSIPTPSLGGQVSSLPMQLKTCLFPNKVHIEGIWMQATSHSSEGCEGPY